MISLILFGLLCGSAAFNLTLWVCFSEAKVRAQELYQDNKKLMEGIARKEGVPLTMTHTAVPVLHRPMPAPYFKSKGEPRITKINGEPA